ncbi:MAG: insulinase family protein [Oscillospiraceae bacterium]|nr:insulinase family protein [Oscillospiraceae bacterium]
MEYFRQQLFPGVALTSLRTEKFKTGVLSLSLLRPLSRRDAALSALTPHVLCQGTASDPDISALSRRCEEMYGARLEPSVRKLGEIQGVGFTVDFVDDAFLPGRPEQLTAAARLLGDVLLRPAGGGGGFADGFVEAERGRLAHAIAATKNNKATYATQRLLECMCHDEAYGVNMLGDEVSALAIEPDALWAHYREMLASSRVELLYVGPQPAARVAGALADALSDLPRRESFAEVGTEAVSRAAGELRRFEETMQVAQGKMAIGARTGVTAADADYPAALLAVEIYGGFPASKLFVNVRERLQLCYYASAKMEGFKGLMLVSTGIDREAGEEAQQEIFRQWAHVQNGEISAEEMSAARLSLRSRLRVLTDGPHSLENYYLGQAAAGLSMGLEKLADKIGTITVEQVARAARRATWDSVYFLGPGGNGPCR